MNRIQAVVFDWAGTTVDFGSCAPVEAVRRVFDIFGVPITDAEARAPMGLLKLDHIRAILRMPRVADAWHEHYGIEPAEMEARHVHERFIPLQKGILGEHTRVIDGVVEAVARLRKRGIRIGSTTGYSRDLLEPVLKSASAQGYTPDAVVTPDEVGAGRPAPFMMLQNAVRLRVWPPSSIVKVGDTPVDVQEGRSVGAWTVAVSATGNGIGRSRDEFERLPPCRRQELIAEAREKLKVADFVIDTLCELDGVIDAIESSPEGKPAVTSPR